MSIGVSITINGFDVAAQRLADLERPDFNEALETVGALVESQTKRRIQEDKESSEGKAWAPWSDAYARTRHGGQSLLQGEGNLLESVQFLVSGDELEVGSNIVYAATHQFGDRRLAWGRVMVMIPARPWLGLSAENEAEILEVLNDFLAETARGRR